MSPGYGRQLMGIHGRQMISELNGLSCHPMEAFGRIRQTVMKGRLFGRDTSDFNVIEAALASLTARAAFAIRREGLAARTASLSLSTNRHKPGYERQTAIVNLITPSADTGQLTAALVAAADRLFSAAKSYHRANVLLYNLVPADRLQTDVFGEVRVDQDTASKARLTAVDALNARYGKTTVRWAAEDLSDAWEPKHAMRSPRYTTHWQELPTVRVLKD